MDEHLTDIRKYTPEVDAGAVAAIVKYCGIALRRTDTSLVAASDRAELNTVRDGFAAKKLGLAPDAAEAAIRTVVQKMKDTPQKKRVTFYYLLAEASGTLGKLGLAKAPG